MGWGNCGTDSKGRPIGYVHAATCDHPGCETEIDRGLAYACGGMHGTNGAAGDDLFETVCCEGYFCNKHTTIVTVPHDVNEDEPCSAHICLECAAWAEQNFKDEPENWRGYPKEAAGEEG